jgi:chromosome segregation ATPase
MPVEPNSIESALKALWDKARRAAEAIARLKAENSELHSNLAQTHEALSQLRMELTGKEEIIKKLNTEKTESQSTQNAVFSNGERQELSARLRELLGKIESYL